MDFFLWIHKADFNLRTFACMPSSPHGTQFYRPGQIPIHLPVFGVFFFFFFFSVCAGSLLLHRLSLVAVSDSYSLVLVCKLLLMGVSLVVEHGF